MSDLVVGETTCDGKKKMFEVLQAKGIKDIYVMHLPQMPDEAGALPLWVSELRRLKHFLETLLGVTITDAALRRAIHITNEENRTRQELFDLNQRKPAIISGVDMMAVTSWPTVWSPFVPWTHSPPSCGVKPRPATMSGMKRPSASCSPARRWAWAAKR
jgi:benzoyl-CoA reductase/2-hydroxyglutaryl-CoA dehydratase subunit BcrC/BadD/HgdB